MFEPARTWALLVVLCVVVTAAASSREAELQVAMWINDMEEITKTQAILDGYMAANPGVRLELIQQPWDGYHEKLIALAAGGVTPDVMVVERRYLPSFAHNGIVRPVDQWLAKERFDVRRDVTEMASGTWNGRQYGIPIWGGPAIMAINVDMFELIGLPLPVTLARQGDWSWDRVIEIGKKLTRDTNGDGMKDVFALAVPGAWQPDWYGKIRSFGGDVIRGNQVVADSPETQRGLQLFADLRWTHHIAPQPGESADFEQGTQAMNYVWTSEAPNLALRVAGRFVVDLATMPTGPAGLFHVAGGCPVTVSSSTPYPEEAYKFAVWFAMESDEWKLRGIPASMNTVRREYRAYLAEFFASPDVMIEALSSATDVEPSVHLYGTELAAGWDPIIADLAEGRISATEAATQLARHTSSVLSSK